MDLGNSTRTNILNTFSEGHRRLVEVSSQAWRAITPKLRYVWQWIHNIFNSFLSYSAYLLQTYPYLLIGVGSCSVIIVTWKILDIKKSKQNKQNEKNVGKDSHTDEDSTRLSRESLDYKSDDSLLDIKLPLDAIMELDNEDDEDRLFFEVIRNYRYT